MSIKFVWSLGIALIVSLFFSVQAEEYFLMKDGKSACEIVVPENAPDHVRFAAKELSAFLARIANGEKPVIVKSPSGKLYPVSFRLCTDKWIKRDGFILEADKKGLVISCTTEVSALYGAYEILKKYGGILWLLPGDDGEYFTVKPTIAVPKQKTVREPFRQLRSGNGMSLTRDSRKWMVRNYMNIPVRQHMLSQKEYRELGAKIYEGYHCFSRLLTGERENWKITNERLDALYKEHPEYFPLVNGKRINLLNPVLGFSDKQPCTSNPDVIRIMKKNLEKVIEDIQPDGIYYLANNDGMTWCQCENCRKLDSEMDRKHHFVTGRYWTLYRELTRDIFKKYPNMRILGCPYQNFQAMPEDKKILPEHGRIQIAFNRTCWRHRIDDPACPTNGFYYRNFEDWKQQKCPLSSWEQISSCGTQFLPIEFAMRDRLKYYEKINCEMFPEVWPPNITYPSMLKRYRNKMTFHQWETIWQGIYFMANYQWDRNTDFDATYEKINSLYYGKGWEGGMKELRGFLVETFHNAPGCAGHGHGSPLGRMLEKPGVKAKILALFDKAEKAASADPDKRALSHVKNDRMFFENTWVKEYEEYVSNFREITIYRRKGEIVIDGELTEKDWKNADIITRFWSGKTKSFIPDEQQTFLRLTYDNDNLYFAVEALEPHPEKIVSEVREHDGEVWRDNTIELFLNHPDMNESFYQLVFNALGTCFDWGKTPGKEGDLSFEAKAEVKTKILKDRWVLEGRIPTENLGAKCMDGSVWKIGMIRRRLLSDGTDVSSGLGKGAWGIVSMFQNMNFAGERKMNAQTTRQEETRFFPNGSLDEVRKLEVKRFKSDKRIADNWNVINGIVPAKWHISNAPGAKELLIEMVKHPETEHNYFMRTSGRGQIHQYTTRPVKKAKVSFKLKGRGTALILISHHTKKDGKVDKRYKSIPHIYKLDSDAWKSYSFDYDSGGEERYLVWSLVTTGGTVCLDDVMVIPAE
ncbi:MAG: DUF4838 domain-containing protein [Lentisphaeria bacterium]|nr:DUF4838 domain-containing protein [Lentisphaeria bacterium]